MLLSALGVRISVESADAEFTRLFGLRYSRLVSPMDDEATDFRVRHRRDESGAMHLLLPGGESVPVRDPAEALDRIDTEIVLALQRQRADLLFLHSATLVRDGRACLLAGPSGVGKSTTTWALLHHGFSYASDELSAVDVDTLTVFPYARALCLKRPPPASFALPPSAIRSGDRWFLPTEVLPTPVVHGSCPVAAVFVLERSANESAAKLQEIGAAEAAARLYPAVLNALAHPDRGLSPVLRVVRALPCFRLSLGPLDQNCVLIRNAVDSLERPNSPRTRKSGEFQQTR